MKFQWYANQIEKLVSPTGQIWILVLNAISDLLIVGTTRCLRFREAEMLQIIREALQKDPKIDARDLKMWPQMNTFATPKQPPDALSSWTIEKRENEHKLSSPGIPKRNQVLKANVQKGIEKPILETDAKNMQIWTLPDLQNYGFRAREAAIFTISRDAEHRH